MTQAAEPTRVDVLGVHVCLLDLPSAVNWFSRVIGDGDRREYVCVTGMHGVMESRRDPALRTIHNQSGLTTPDGMPMVWAGRFARRRDRRSTTGQGPVDVPQKIERVYGPDLMLAVLEEGASCGWRSYFLGGAPGVPERLSRVLVNSIPGITLVGSQSPPYRLLTPEEDAQLLADINAARPDILWVGLGTPKQERWMAAHRGALDAPILVGIGAAFDLISGSLRQAPRWMQRAGLEWLYRLAVEPRRLWRRYLLNIPRFLVSVIRHPPRIVRLDAPTSTAVTLGDPSPTDR